MTKLIISVYVERKCLVEPPNFVGESAVMFCFDTELLRSIFACAFSIRDICLYYEGTQLYSVAIETEKYP